MTTLCTYKGDDVSVVHAAAADHMTDGRQGRAPGFWGQLASNSDKNVKGLF